MRCLTNEPLSVEPVLVGLRLASPSRRFLAFAVDAVLLVVPTVLVAFTAAYFSLQSADPRAAAAVRTLVASRFVTVLPEARRQAFRDFIPVLVRTEARGLPAEAKRAVEEGDLERAADAMKGYDLSLALNLGEGNRAETQSSRKGVMLDVGALIPTTFRAFALFGVPALYFLLFTRSRRGATVGKWLFGIRVLRLDGERLSYLESLERFVGYAHIPGTLFLSIFDLWRDPNRRLPHDRVVHTAVFRLPRRAPSPAAHAERRTEHVALST